MLGGPPRALTRPAGTRRRCAFGRIWGCSASFVASVEISIRRLDFEKFFALQVTLPPARVCGVARRRAGGLLQDLEAAG